jgi:hypothetical protein
MAVSPQPLARTHGARLAKWRSLASPETRHLIDQVVDRLVPAVVAAGFTRVDQSHLGSDHDPSGSEICLERVLGEEVDVITFNFEKHGKPRVQIHGARRSARAPYQFVRAANLVRSQSQYYCFWGKPWWLPRRLWTASATARVVESARERLGQLLRFLEVGERAGSISKAVTLAPRNGDA